MRRPEERVVGLVNGLKHDQDFRFSCDQLRICAGSGVLQLNLSRVQVKNVNAGLVTSRVFPSAVACAWAAVWGAGSGGRRVEGGGWRAGMCLSQSELK
jgi:hypothetical protein